MKAIYEFYMDCGRMGDVSSTFIADKEDVAKAIGKYIYFGEILGKHSEVTCNLEEDHLEIKTDDQDFIAMFESIMGEGWSTGNNPMEYLPEDEEDEEEDE